MYNCYKSLCIRSYFKVGLIVAIMSERSMFTEYCKDYAYLLNYLYAFIIENHFFRFSWN